VGESEPAREGTKPARKRLRANKTAWHTAAELAEAGPASAWQRLSAGAGMKGEHFHDWTRRRLAHRPGRSSALGQHCLPVRRHGTDPNGLTDDVAFAPADTSLATLARAAGLRWTVEEGFEAARQEVGLADYEVRSWHGWYRPITLAMLALALLVAMRSSSMPHHPQPGQTCRRGLWSISA
jgi:SRSO17 transposase